MRCRGCKEPVSADDVVCDLGLQPLANSLVSDLAAPEVHYPVRPVLCRNCMLMQLPSLDDAIFTADYPFYAGQSAAWRLHCYEFVEDMRKQGLPTSARILELGSNDGTMLNAFTEYDFRRVMGIEPCAEVAQSALRDGIATHIVFWSEALAKGLVSSGYSADLVVATNVLAHVPDLSDFLAGVQKVLAPGGQAVFEVPHVANLLRDCRFDQIYAEHHCYFSLHSLMHALHLAGLVVNDVSEVPTHGGSLRVFTSEPDGAEPHPRVEDLLQREKNQGLTNPDTYLGFQGRPGGVKVNLLRRLTAVTGGTWGYGASAKAITLMNYCGIDTSLIQAVADTTPAKQGKYMPGCRVPIVTPEAMAMRKPTHVVNFLWNWPEESEKNIRELCPDAHILYPSFSKPRESGFAPAFAQSPPA